MNLDDIIKNLPSKETPLFKATFEKMCNAILDKVYPIGMSVIFHDNEDHSNFCGLTWERDLEGLMPIGYNQNDDDFNTIDNTGGEKAHQLTVPEMPSHDHQLREYGARGETTEYVLDVLQKLQTYSTGHISVTGGDQPHNNMPPYKVVAFWKRVA